MQSAAGILREVVRSSQRRVLSRRACGMRHASSAHGATRRASGWGAARPGHRAANLLQQLKKQLGLGRASSLPQGERPAIADHVDMLLSARRGVLAGLPCTGLHPPKAVYRCWSIDAVYLTAKMMSCELSERHAQAHAEPEQVVSGNE